MNIISSAILFAILGVDCQSDDYELVDEYSGNNFFNQFDFRGSINETEAHTLGLINNSNNSVYIGTDYTNIIYPRPSIYLYGKHTYSTGLVIINLTHMPQGCATWPAFWMTAPDWANNGEIDIIEGINLYSSDQSSLHTGPDCSFETIENNTNSYNQTGTWMSTNCTTFIAKNNSFYGGCSINATNSQTYGVDLNKDGGGVFAMELNDNIGVRIWFWLHTNVPNDIIHKKPNPKLWSTPYAFWPFGNWCKSSNFNNLQIVFDLNYCGWAQRDSTWTNQCQDTIAKKQNCTEFVKNNPSYFVDAYWNINYVDVYQFHNSLY